MRPLQVSSAATNDSAGIRTRGSPARVAAATANSRVRERGLVSDVGAAAVGSFAVNDAEPLVVPARICECLFESAIGGLEVIVAEPGEGDEGVRSLHA